MGKPSLSYRVMRKAWPHVPPDVRRRLGRRRDHAQPVEGGIVGPHGAQIVADLRRDGVAIFPAPLDAERCDALEAGARSVEAVAEATGERTLGDDLEQLHARRFDLPEEQMLGLPSVQELVVDPSLRALATTYLGGRAVNDLCAMWWTVAREGAPDSQAAQLFHSDRDRLSFVKFFVYLSDVDEDHGPHVYVKGSHRHLPRSLRADRRFDDDEVAAAFGDETIVTVTGPRGTVFAADTAGLHKGLPPRRGHRLVFQMEFATNLFGAPYVEVDRSTLDEPPLSTALAHPDVYGRLLADP